MPVHRHVLGLSGGRDSAALAVYMREHHHEIEVEYFFTDTGKELPEVYEFLGRLEGFLGKEIVRLNPNRDFDFWLRQYNNFLPSPRTRWCTRQLKIKPFEDWIAPTLASGGAVTTYVAIRADEDSRQAYTPTNRSVFVETPFIGARIEKRDVIRILDDSGLGLPEYYRWRSRSGCTFCFFQQKIEWVRLKTEHPTAFEEAKLYEKTALEHGSPFTWSDGEALCDLEMPDRIRQVEGDYLARIAHAKKRQVLNSLLEDVDTDMEIDDVYGVDEGGGACFVCHK